MPAFRTDDRVIDTRTGDLATVLGVDYTTEGDDGYAIVVEYDDEPGVSVSTGTDYFDMR